jgi:hypothetical protein
MMRSSALALISHASSDGVIAAAIVAEESVSCKHIQGTFSQHSVNIQGTFREHSGNIQSTFREHSAYTIGCPLLIIIYYL